MLRRWKSMAIGLLGITFVLAGGTGITRAADNVNVNSLPKSAQDAQTYIKWEAKGSSDRGNVSSNAVLAGDKLYWVSGSTLYQINKDDGEILKTTKLTYGNGYNYFLTSGDGMIFVQEGLYVEAYDTNLDKKWTSESMASGTQGLTPLYYAEGFVYGGTVGVGDETGCYFCIDAASGTVEWKKEADLKSCGVDGNNTGYYWAGATADGEYLLYGSEGGRVYSVRRTTGDVADTFDTSTDYTESIRSTVVSEGDSLYFVTTSGELYKVSYDEDTGKFGASQNKSIGTGIAGNCTSTPAIYNNRIYIGYSGGVSVFDIADDNLNYIYTMSSNLGSIRNICLVPDTTNGCVYGISQYYKTPGSIVMFSDKPGQTSGKLEDFSSLTQMAAAEFSASTPICGSDGTIYFSNDSGVLMSISKNNAYLTGLKGNGTFEQNFQPGYLNYGMKVAPNTTSANFEMKVPDGAIVTVNGTPCDVENGSTGAAVLLENGKGTADICVQVGVDSRTYEVSITPKSTDTGLKEALISESNSYGVGTFALTSITDGIYGNYNANATWKRLWVKTQDENATYQVYGLTSFGTKTKVDATTGELTEKITSGSNSYYKLYFADNKTTMAVRIHVTAEDGGTTKDYYYIVTQSGKDSYLISTEYGNLITKIANGNSKYESYKNQVLKKIAQTRDISYGSCKAVNDLVYNGKKQSPDVTLTLNNTVLKKNVDYTLSYQNNQKIGIGRIVITGKGNYIGTKNVTFKIIPKSTKITKIQSGSKKLTIGWKKVAGVTGYKIYRSTSKKGTYKCIATVKGEKKISYVNKKLKGKKTYYYKVVAYKTVAKKTYISKYSAVKAGKTKK